MSSGATRAFLPILRRLEGELSIPLPHRVSVLQELEADLEELTATFVARGYRVVDARRMAEEALVPDGTALGELRRVHASSYERLVLRFGGSRLRVVERTALVLATTAVVVLEAVALSQMNLGYDPSPFIWPVLALTGLLFAAIVASAFSLWIKKDESDPSRAARGVLPLAGLVLGTGLGGVMIDLYLLAAGLEAAPAQAATLFLQWLRRDGSLLAVSMLASLLGGLTWFVLTQWRSALAAARARALGLEHDNITKGAR